MAESVGTLVADLSLGGIAQFQSGLKKASGGFAKLGTAAKIAGGLIAGAIAFKAVQAFGEAVGAAIEFEKAIAEVGTLTNATAEETAVLSDRVRELSSQFGSPAVETAAALYQTISAGFSDAADSSTILTAALKLGIGGVTDTTTAVDGLTTILNSYGIGADGATSVSDKLFVAMRAGKTTIAELSASMGQVSSIAASLGVSLDETLASVSALTTGGLKTSVAVTSLRQAFVGILKPTAQAAELAKELGIDFNAAALKSKGLAGFLADLRTKTGGSTEALSLLFGSVEAVQAVLGLTGPQAEAFTKTLGQMGSAAGSTADAVAKMADTTDFKIKQATAAWDNLTETLASKFLPTVRDVAVGFTMMIDIVEGAIEANDRAAKASREHRKSLVSLTDVNLGNMAEGIELLAEAEDDARKAGDEFEQSLLDNLGSVSDEVAAFGTDLGGLDAAIKSSASDMDVLGEKGSAAAKKAGDAVNKILNKALKDSSDQTKELVKQIGNLGEALAALDPKPIAEAFEGLKAAADAARAAAAVEGPGVDFAQGGLRGAFGPGPGGELRGLGITGEVAAGEGPGAKLKSEGDAAAEAFAKAAGDTSTLGKGLALFGAEVSGVSAALATGDLLGAAIALVAGTGALDGVMKSVSGIANALVAPFQGLFDGLSIVLDVVAELVSAVLAPLAPAFESLGELLAIVGEVVGVALIPAMEVLEPVLKAFSKVVETVAGILGAIAKSILDVFIFVLKALDAIPFVDLGKTIRKFEKARDDIGNRQTAAEDESIAATREFSLELAVETANIRRANRERAEAEDQARKEELTGVRFTRALEETQLSSAVRLAAELEETGKLSESAALKLADALDEAGASSAAGALEMQGSAGAARALELSLDPATIALLGIAKTSAEVDRANKELADSTDKVNAQFRQLPSGFKIRRAIFQSLTGIARPGDQAQPGGLAAGPSLFDLERAGTPVPGPAPGGGPKANIVIENQTVVTPDASGFADELDALKDRGNVVRTGDAAGNQAAFAGTPG